MRKMVTAFFVFMLLLIAIPAAYAGSLKIMLNGDQINFVDAQPYINEDGRTMVPVRFISEELGATVNWVPASQTVEIN